MATELTPENLAGLRAAAALARVHAAHYRMPATGFDSPLATYIAAADPQTVLGLLDEVERLRAKNDKLRKRLHHPCDGCPGCSSDDCADALSIAKTELAKYKWAVHVECTDAGYTYDSALAEALRERDELQRRLDNNQIECELSAAVAQKAIVQMTKLQARVAGLETVMAQRMGVYAEPKGERQVGS